MNECEKEMLNGHFLNFKDCMSTIDERNALLKSISNTNLIPSLKSQIKMSVRDRLKNRGQIKQSQPSNPESEIAKNIILEYLFSNGFHNTASVFFTESNVHQMPRSEILEGLQINDRPGLIAELLITNTSHPSISTQTENMDLNAKLDAIDREIKRKKEEGRIISSEEMLRRGIEDLDHEFEERFNKELHSRLDLFRATDLANSASLDAQRHSSELQRIQKEMEADLKLKTTELRAQFQRDSDLLRVKRREIEREIGKWADQNVKSISNEAHSSEAEAIKADTEAKAQKIQEKTLILEKKEERERRKLEDLQLEHNRAKREVEKLKLAISMHQSRQ